MNRIALLVTCLACSVLGANDAGGKDRAVGVGSSPRIFNFETALGVTHRLAAINVPVVHPAIKNQTTFPRDNSIESRGSQCNRVKSEGNAGSYTSSILSTTRGYGETRDGVCWAYQSETLPREHLQCGTATCICPHHPYRYSVFLRDIINDAVGKLPGGETGISDPSSLSRERLGRSVGSPASGPSSLGTEDEAGDQPPERQRSDPELEPRDNDGILAGPCHLPLLAKVGLVMVLGFLTVWFVYPAIGLLVGHDERDNHYGWPWGLIVRDNPRLAGWGLLGLSLLLGSAGLLLGLSFGWCYAMQP
jgi:hypothetical protein